MRVVAKSVRLQRVNVLAVSILYPKSFMMSTFRYIDMPKENLIISQISQTFTMQNYQTYIIQSIESKMEFDMDANTETVTYVLIYLLTHNVFLIQIYIHQALHVCSTVVIMVYFPWLGTHFACFYIKLNDATPYGIRLDSPSYQDKWPFLHSNFKNNNGEPPTQAIISTSMHIPTSIYPLSVFYIHFSFHPMKWTCMEYLSLVKSTDTH